MQWKCIYLLKRAVFVSALRLFDGYLIIDSSLSLLIVGGYGEGDAIAAAGAGERSQSVASGVQLIYPKPAGLVVADEDLCLATFDKCTVSPAEQHLAFGVGIDIAVALYVGDM